MASRRKKRSSFNPFISLTDILFNLVLVLIFVTALFAQDITRKYAENSAFQNRLNALQLERDELFSSVEGLNSDLDAAAALEAELQGLNTSLEEQIGALVSNLDSAQLFQQALAERISVLIADLDDTELEKQILEEKLTVVIGDLDVTDAANKLLEEEITLTLGNLDQAQRDALNLRSQVADLSRNNFLVIELEWFTQSHDLDLHIVDPRGNRFYWNQATYEDESSRLTLDNRLGARPNKPGLEIWTARDVISGVYQVEVGLWGCDRASENDSYKLCTADGTANLLIRHRDGDDLIANVDIPANQSYANINGSEFTLDETLFDRLITIATIEITDNDGELNLEVLPANGLISTRLATTN